MKRLTLLGLAMLALVVVLPGSAYAQATRTWVSGVGDDANPCSRTAPCKTFAGAISKTAPGGEIDVLDPGGFGALTITKSITIDGSPGSIGGVLVAGTNGFVVSAAANDVVILRNLDIDGLLGNGSNAGNAGINGVRFLTGASLTIQNCQIYGFNTWGVDFEPTGTSSMAVINSTLTNNGAGTTGGGILIAPNGGMGKAAITGTKLISNVVGLKGLGDNSTTNVNVEVDNTQSFGSPHSGFVSSTGGGAHNGPVSMMLNNIFSAGNNVGVQASGTNAFLLVGNSTITENNTGVTAVNGGVVVSYKNNQIDGNGNNGTPVPAGTLN